MSGIIQYTFSHLLGCAFIDTGSWNTAAGVLNCVLPPVTTGWRSWTELETAGHMVAHRPTFCRTHTNIRTHTHPHTAHTPVSICSSRSVSLSLSLSQTSPLYFLQLTTLISWQSNISWGRSQLINAASESQLAHRSTWRGVVWLIRSLHFNFSPAAFAQIWQQEYLLSQEHKRFCFFLIFWDVPEDKAAVSARYLLIIVHVLLVSLLHHLSLPSLLFQSLLDQLSHFTLLPRLLAANHEPGTKSNRSGWRLQKIAQSWIWGDANTRQLEAFKCTLHKSGRNSHPKKLQTWKYTFKGARRKPRHFSSPHQKNKKNYAIHITNLLNIHSSKSV